MEQYYAIIWHSASGRHEVKADNMATVRHVVSLIRASLVTAPRVVSVSKSGVITEMDIEQVESYLSPMEMREALERG